MNTTRDWLAQRAISHPQHRAVTAGEQQWSYAKLATAASGCDRLLREIGVSKGDRVAVLLSNRPETVALLHAVPRGGRILVPLGTRLSPVELQALLQQSDAKILLCDEVTKQLAGALAHDAETHCIAPQDIANADPADADTIDLQATHSIVFTSGSSGTAKGVQLTWANHFWSATASAFNLGVASDDRWLLCMPLNHVGGLSVLMRAVLYGTTVDLLPKFDPTDVHRAIDERGVTQISVVANMLQRMLDERGDRPYPISLRTILVGGGPIPRSLVEECQRRRVPIAPTYGLTETASQIATAAPLDGTPVGSSGKALFAAEVRIVDDDGREVETGNNGTIQVRGPMVTNGYLGRPRRAPDEWLDTRDYGSIDEDGFIFVAGRADDTVVSGGENVHPGEIERALESHPLVLEAFSCGTDDATWGEALLAGVRLDGEADEAELRTHCNSQLARFKVPKRIFLVDDFPRTSAGKLARREAAEQIRAKHKTTD